MADLRPRLAARFDLVRHTVTVAGTQLTITMVRDTNVLLDRITPEEFSRDERLPYWAELWTSSLELARWALEGGVGPGTEVLELGCGVGLAGIAAARAGGSVTMTDYEPDALDFARLNVADNLPRAGGMGEARVELLDWRVPYRGRCYPLVLGGDVIYDRSMFDPLLARLDECLTPGGRAVLADPDRAVGQAFLERAARTGFAAEGDRVMTRRNGKTVTVVRTILRRSEA